MLLFTRLDALFAVRFDAGKLELKGEPVPIMNGLRQNRQALNAAYGMTPNGTLAFASGGNIMRSRRLVIVDRKGNVSEWSPERRAGAGGRAGRAAGGPPPRARGPGRETLPTRRAARAGAAAGGGADRGR